MKRKLYTILACLVCVVQVWAYDFEVDGIYYNQIDYNEVEVTYRGDEYGTDQDRGRYEGNVVIPASITVSGTTYNVTGIGEEAFTNCIDIQSVVIPNSVTSIGTQAFWQCSALQFVTIPNSVTSIGTQAFWECSALQFVIIPNSVTSIGHSAFWECSALQSVTIPNSVTSIGTQAFWQCSSLQSITIPNSVTSIGRNAFRDCIKLIEIIVSESNSHYTSIEGVLYNKNLSELITYPAGKNANHYVIPNSVTSIASGAFSNCKSLQSVIIPDRVTSIGEGAFSGCESLQSATIPDRVTSIESSAFFGTAIWRNENNWKDGVFYVDNCAMTAFFISGTCTILEGTRMIADGAFFLCGELQSVIIPNSVKYIGSDAFDTCFGLQSISIPNSVTSIGSGAFYGCIGLQSIYIHHTQPVFIEYSDIFNGVDKDNCILHVPVGSKSAYETAPVWKDFRNIVEVDYTGIPTSPSSEEFIYMKGNTLVIEHAAIDAPVHVYTLSGALLQSLQVIGDYMELTLPREEIYLVQIGGKTYKIKG